MPTTRELLASGTARLAQAGVPSPRNDAELLLAHVTGHPRATIGLGVTVAAPEAARFAECLDLRSRRIPLQHITGRAPFRYLELAVGPGVFIPRPETELLIDRLLDHIDGGALVVDLCTGSAALALSAALEAPGSRVIAVDILPPALEWARGNITDHAERLQTAHSTVELLAADATAVAGPGGALADLSGRVDAVVTNPPYIPEAAVPRDAEVRDHDPGLALYAGPTGLEVIAPLARQAALLLRPGGMLLVEHADAQGEDAGPLGVPDLLRGQRDRRGEPVWARVRDHEDLAGSPRFTSALRCPLDHLSRSPGSDP